MHEHPHHAPHDHAHDDSMADVLDLDARMHRPYFDALLDEIVTLTGIEPRTIVDVGAGTGAGTLALARRFPRAEIVAVDLSDRMLARLREAARRDGVDARVRTVEADLDAGRPAVDSIDLAWAALSLHHVENPDALLKQLAGAVNPGGVLVVTEMKSQPRFLPDDIGIGRPGLEVRCHEAAATQGWNRYPDWSEHLRRAGLDVVETRHDELRVETDDIARRYAHAVLSRIRSGLGRCLLPEDLDTLDRLVAHGPASVLHRDDLVVRETRTVWIARKPTMEDSR